MNLLFYVRIFSTVLACFCFMSNSFVYAQKEDVDEVKMFEQLKLAQEYANSMNAKLNKAIQKSKSFKEMNASWENIVKSDPSKVEKLLKEFYTKYKNQIEQAKIESNYNEKAIAGKMADYLKGFGYNIDIGNGAFLISKGLVDINDIVAYEPAKCIDYEANELVLGSYTGPPSMGILFGNTAIGVDNMELDRSGNDLSGRNIIVDTKVSNGRFGQGFSKLLKVKVPKEFSCADLKITCSLETIQEIFGIMLVGADAESIARVKVKRIGLPGNFMSDGELYTFRLAYFFGSIGGKSSHPNNVYENGLNTVKVSKIIRVRSGDELEILFEAASHVEAIVGLPGRAVGRVKNIVVSMCKCD